MNHYKPSERVDGRFDYTCLNRRTKIHPIGYCHAYRPLTPERSTLSQDECDRLNEQERPYESKYHADGHATAKEACACYRRYLLDHHVQLREPPTDPHSLHKCAVCGAFTAGGATCDMQSWHLCDEHRTRAEVENLFPEVEESWRS